MNIKKILLIIGCVILAIALVFGGYYLAKIKYDKLIFDYNQQISNLKQQLDDIGQLTPAYIVAVDVPKNKKIDISDLKQVYVQQKIAQISITNPSEIKGKFYRIDLKAGTLLLKNLVVDDPIKDNERLYDVVLDEIPIGLNKNDYVDIRVSMPFGEDFIAMSKKRVYDIYGNILKLKVDEKDLHVYNSMLIDKILYPGTRIYAVTYVEPGTQKAALDYYPVSRNVFSVLVSDPNLLEKVKQDMISKRGSLESSLKSAINPQIAEIIRQGKMFITQEMEKERMDFEMRKKMGQQ